MVAGWVSAGPQLMHFMSSSCPQMPCSAALQPGQTRHVADLGRGDNWEAISFLWQKPTHSYWVRALLECKRNYWGLGTTGREMQPYF